MTPAPEQNRPTNPTGAAVPERRDLWIAAGLFAAALLVYLRTLCPTVYWGDCGELATAAYTLGIPHPTGYPVWCLLGKAWTLLLPFGTIVWRLNVLSAVVGALGVAFLYGFARWLPLPRPLALAGAGLFAFSHTFWQQCLFTETYSLTACYTCALLFLAARWRGRGCRPEDLRRLAFAYGLAMTNHQTNTLFLPGFVAFVLWTDPHLRRLGEAQTRRQWAGTLGWGLLPLLSYVYLPLRAAAHPAVAWGDPRTPFAFWYHVTGRCYAGNMFHDSALTVVGRLLGWALGLRFEFAWPLLPLALAGLVSLWRTPSDRPLALLLTWVIAADLAYTANYDIYNAYIYFLPSYIALCALAGRGVWRLWARLQSRLADDARPRVAAWAACALLALVPVQALSHWRANDLSRDWTCYDYGRNLLAGAPTNAILVNNQSDTAWAATTYLQDVEHFRPDVTVLERCVLEAMYDVHYRRWVNAWVYDQLRRTHPDVARLGPPSVTPKQACGEVPLRQIVDRAVAQGRPVAFIHVSALPTMLDDRGHEVPLPRYLKTRYATAPVGLLLRLYPRGHRPPNAQLLTETRRVWQSYSLRGVYQGLYLGDDFLTPIALDYADAGLARARLCERQGEWAEAADAYAGVLRLFQSDEARTGLARCAQAQKRPHPLPTVRDARDTQRHPRDTKTS